MLKLISFSSSKMSGKCLSCCIHYYNFRLLTESTQKIDYQSNKVSPFYPLFHYRTYIFVRLDQNIHIKDNKFGTWRLYVWSLSNICSPQVHQDKKISGNKWENVGVMSVRYNSKTYFRKENCQAIHSVAKSFH